MLYANRMLLRGDEPVGIITHRDIILFCRWCAEQAHSRYQNVPPEARAALTLVDRRLIDPGSVSCEELKEVSTAAWDVSRYSAATWAVVAAARVAWAVAEAADAAWTATLVSVAAEAAGVSYEDQVQWLVEYLKLSQ